MKKRILACVVIIATISMLMIGCTSVNSTDEISDRIDNMFVRVGRNSWLDAWIVYDTETKVMYTISDIPYNKETMTHYCEAVGFEVMFNGYKCFAVNMGMMSSDDFVINNIDDYDMLIGFVFNGHEWRYSLRSTKVDCSKVAMLYGGGGHKGAAGFNTKECVLER